MRHDGEKRERHQPAETERGGSSIDSDHTRWLREVYGPAIEARPARRSFQVDAGYCVDPLYSPKSLEDIGFDYHEDVGFPGEYPFTRGDSATMFRSEPFVVSAYAGHGEAGECNRRFHKLI